MTIPPYLVSNRTTLESTARHYGQSAFLGDKTILCRVLGKYMLYADTDDISITPHLCLNGYWESWITIAMARILKPGWHCVDIGANQGYYTVIMADAVGPTGHVLAIEPNPRLVELLKFTLEVNGLQDHTTILQNAVSNTTEQSVTLTIPQRHQGGASLYLKAAATDGVVKAETITLDDATRGWSCVDLVKIDAEGSEQMIWNGMQQTLVRNPNIRIIMEIDCSRYSDPQAFLRTIQDAGFTLRCINLDCSIQDVTEEQLLQSNELWMLYLHRKDHDIEA